MIWQDTPIFIIARDRVSTLRDLVLWLRRAGMTKIGIIDNASTYPPLLRYYEEELPREVQLLHACGNLGHEAFWRLDLHLKQTTRFIVTDPDILPDENCPLDLVRKMHEVADRFPGGAKVGPAIRIDDIPDHFTQREHMRFCESDYWLRKYPEGDCWNAAIDTVFALYEPAWTRWPLDETGGIPHVRLDFPYVVRHLPWYEDSANPSEETKYYRAHVAPGFSSSCMIPEVA